MLRAGLIHAGRAIRWKPLRSFSGRATVVGQCTYEDQSTVCTPMFTAFPDARTSLLDCAFWTGGKTKGEKQYGRKRFAICSVYGFRKECLQRMLVQTHLLLHLTILCDLCISTLYLCDNSFSQLKHLWKMMRKGAAIVGRQLHSKVGQDIQLISLVPCWAYYRKRCLIKPMIILLYLLYRI